MNGDNAEGDLTVNYTQFDGTQTTPGSVTFEDSSHWVEIDLSSAPTTGNSNGGAVQITLTPSATGAYQVGDNAIGGAFLGAPAAPKPADEEEDPTPKSEKGDGNFRKGFLKLLVAGKTELPDGWEAHHKYLQALDDRWNLSGVKWNDPTNGLGVPGVLNREFYSLYQAWLKKYGGGDPKKFKLEDFEKLNKAIEVVYKDFVILPTDTQAIVDTKTKAWFKALHPTGKTVNGDAAAWKKDQDTRFGEVWKQIDGKK